MRVRSGAGAVPVRWAGGWRSLRRRSLIIGLPLAGSVMIVVVAAFVVGYLSVDVPQLKPSVTVQASLVTYADGRGELGRLGVVDRRAVPLRLVPVSVRQAVLAAEDRGFYHEPAVSAPAILRAAWANLTRRGTQGGSTITQQYVKNAYLTHERSMARKLREVFIAIKLERRQTKDEILQGYLNATYFGRGAYGIDAAARAYFGRPVGRMSTAQAAYLAALIQSPAVLDSSESPAVRQRLQRRWRYVIDGMVSAGWLRRADAEALRPPRPLPPRAMGRGPEVYLLQAVAAELQRHGLSGQDIATGGLRIRTTIDRRLQRAAADAIDSRLWRRLRPGRRPDRDVRAGLVALRPRDGAVLALYGGRDYRKRQLNDATQSLVPVSGRLFSPLLRAAELDALATGQVPVRMKGRLGEVWRRTGGPGPRPEQVPPRDRTRATLRGLGLGADTIGLGSDSRLQSGDLATHVVDLAAAYATIAAGGRHAAPYLVGEVRFPDGRLLYRAGPVLRPALEPQVAARTHKLLLAAAAGRTGSGRVTAPPPDTASASGTALYQSAAWSVVFNPDLTIAAAIFRDGPRLGSRPRDRSLDTVAGTRPGSSADIPGAITDTIVPAAPGGLGSEGH